jgi:isopenicillin N synthase-like dioxygenase
VDYADLAIIDISKSDTEEGRAALAIEVREALLDYGFFYVVNHGYSQDQVRQFFDIVWIINVITTQTDRIFDIADLPFSAVSDSEKKIYAGTMKQSGSYQGYKLRQYWVRGRRVTHHMSV